MLRASESRSLLVRIIQRVTTFKKASVNIVFEKGTETTETTESTAPGISGSTTSGSTGKMAKKAAKKTMSVCEACKEQQAVCIDCEAVGQMSHLPCFRACSKCLQKNIKCTKCLVLTWSVDCESGNRKMADICSNDDNPNLAYLVVVPDTVHLGKTYKWSWSNWFLILGEGDRSSLATLRMLRNDSDPVVSEKLHKRLTAESVRNKDRMAVEPLLELTKQELLDLLKSRDTIFVAMNLIPDRYRINDSNKRCLYSHPFAICTADTGKLVFLNWNPKTNTSNLVQLLLHSPTETVVLEKNIQTSGITLCYMNGIAVFCGQEGILFHDVEALRRTKAKSSQFRTKAAAASFIQQHIDVQCDAQQHSLKSPQEKIKNYLETKKTSHKSQGSLGVVTLDSNIQFSSVCLGNGDMLIGASNSTKKVYSITTDFDGVGILGAVNEMCSYADGWTRVSSLALSGDELAVCADGVLHIFDPTQGETGIVTDLDGHAISSHAVNVMWIGKDILFCEDHSVKMFQSGTVEVIAGKGKGESDGSQTHSKLCQPIGICVEFDRNIYVADSGCGAIKLVNRPLAGIAEFLGKLQVLVTALNIHSKRSTERKPQKSVGEAIGMVDDVLENVKSCSQKARQLQSLRRETTDGPEACSYSLKKDTFTLYEYAQIFGSSVEEGVKRVTPWSAHYYTHPNSYFLSETSDAGQLVRAEIPKPVGQRMSRNDEAEMRFWAKRYGNRYYLTTQGIMQDGPLDESAETRTTETDEQPPETVEGATCHDQPNEYSGSDSGDSESDEEGADDGDGYANKG
ncbi:hypothetical protein ACROYT_G019861 [Oculina patagonica]